MSVRMLIAAALLVGTVAGAGEPTASAYAGQEAHLAQTALLDADQTARYMELRGYEHPSTQDAHQHHRD